MQKTKFILINNASLRYNSFKFAHDAFCFTLSQKSYFQNANNMKRNLVLKSFYRMHYSCTLTNHTIFMNPKTTSEIIWNQNFSHSAGVFLWSKNSRLSKKLRNRNRLKKRINRQNWKCRVRNFKVRHSN